MIESSSIDEYLKRLASRAGTPGGGAVAAMAGAQAAALVSMVCELTKHEEAAPISARAATARTRFIELANEDMAAFESVMNAWRLRGPERDAPLQRALQEAARAPLEMIATALSLVDDLQRLADIGNPNLVTDTGIAALELETCVKSAVLNVLVNLRSIEDAEFAREARSVLDTAQTEVLRIAKLASAVRAGLEH